MNIAQTFFRLSDIKKESQEVELVRWLESTDCNVRWSINASDGQTNGTTAKPLPPFASQLDWICSLHLEKFCYVSLLKYLSNALLDNYLFEGKTRYFIILKIIYVTVEFNEI